MSINPTMQDLCMPRARLGQATLKEKLGENECEANPCQIMEEVKVQRLFQTTGGSLFNATPAVSLRRNKFNRITDQWIKGSTDAVESLQEAKQRIFAFFNSNLEVNTLLLSNLDLTSLPDIFHLEPFRSRLAQLDTSCNKLITLPESFGNLQALKKLNLSHNQLAGLPGSFGNLQALKYLSLSHNRFVGLPGFFSNLHALKYLSLSHNKITILPGLLGGLQALVQLDASHNYSLSILPMRILNLPSTCIIDLIASNLSQEDLERISKITVGPKILFTYEEKLTEIARKNLNPISSLMQFT